MINEGVQFLLGRVESIGDPKDSEMKDTTIIRFSIPFIMDNLNKYPIAYPIGNHSHKIYKGDSVLITRTANCDRFFYQPMDFSQFIGAKYDDNNYVKVDKDKVTINSSKEVDIHAAETVNISGDSVINVSADNKFILKVNDKEILSVVGNVIKVNTNSALLAFCLPNCLMTGAVHGSNTAMGL